VELPDIISLGKPRRFEPPGRPPWSLAIEFGRYELVERIPSGSDDECYVARMAGIAGFERIAFLRRFDRTRLDKPLMDAIKRQAWITERAVAQVFEVGVIDAWGFIVTEHVAGASVAALGKRAERIPWLVALAIVFDASARMARIISKRGGRDQREPPDPAITPARIILSTSGDVALAMGVPAVERAPWHRALCDMIHPILALAATADERAMLAELFADDNADAVWVACDALVQRHPELDPVLPMVFLSLAGRIDRGEAHRVLVERVPLEQLRALWNHVGATLAGCSRTGSRFA
jgi:hypothetical protein